MGFLSVLGAAQRWCAERIRPGDAVVDATVGGGVDTQFLVERTGPGGLVIGFDIQAAALARARARLAALPGPLPRVELHHAGHERLAELVPPELHGRISAVMFNLGYLPGETERQPIVTLPRTTLAALDAALGVLRPGGAVTVVVYPGHPGGREEADAVDAWAAALPTAAAQAVLYRMAQKPDAPYAYGIEKRG